MVISLDNLFHFDSTVLYWSLLVFLAIFMHVLIGTVRLIMMVKNKKVLAIIIGFLEATIGLSNMILIISNAVKSGINLYIIIFYSLGFSAGLCLGMLVSQKISKDILSITIIANKTDNILEQTLRENGFGVTCYNAVGKEGSRNVLHIICKKSSFIKLQELVTFLDKKAVLSAHTIDGLSGGFLFGMKNKI